ncbi:MAG: hypothetical protein GY780_10995, partial [bacterium]|nr:hypothetical protein [bacterium]
MHRLRAERRTAAKLVQAEKSGIDTPANFNLLVIPVDFSDVRLPSDWESDAELASRLFPLEGQAMANYFHVASAENLQMNFTLSPLINLSGTRRDYSDIGYYGFSRSRLMATEAITKVAQLGLEFRRLDNDGPDGLPGTDDDDGQVDGVLILHAGVGQENDFTNGQIQALQFFIEPAVQSGGVDAAFYAVASMHSGLGIWAHETGHLLGLEDRYDPLLPASQGSSEVRSRGGLGKFSLMSSGAWGTGEGDNPALPDAYSCWQLGWVDFQRLPEAGNPQGIAMPWRENNPVIQVFSKGPLAQEFFLLETRNPELTAPFDQGVPANQVMIYHVDENVPDGSYLVEDTSYHLRVRLIEADNNQNLQMGLDDGSEDDLFPGALDVLWLTPGTLPSSAGYYETTEVSLGPFVRENSGVIFDVFDTFDPFSIHLDFEVLNNSSPLDIRINSLA